MDFAKASLKQKFIVNKGATVFFFTVKPHLNLLTAGNNKTTCHVTDMYKTKDVNHFNYIFYNA